MTKTVLIVIDGLGLGKKYEGNAFDLAKTPTLDKFLNKYPHSLIQASGEFVGLPAGQMGNSEVGHLNIGAGRVVYTGLSLINHAIKTGDFNNNSVLNKVMDDVKKSGKTLHLVGLLSDGGVHSHEDHLFALIELAHQKGLRNVSIHAIGDGRDVAPKSILDSLNHLQEICNEYSFKISSIGGRYYGMDRDKMFDRIQLHFDAIRGNTDNKFSDVIEYVNSMYGKNVTDEFLVPAASEKGLFVQENDSVIFFNFRPDRARQLSHCFIGSDLFEYNCPNSVKLHNFVSMMKYEGVNSLVAIEEMKVVNPIGAVIADAGLKQLRLAETQKYSHVTYFMDGGVDVVYDNSSRIMVDSLKVKTYDLAPKMSAEEITNQLIAHGLENDLVIMNYANPDMVGHTGVLNATIEAIEWLDTQLARVLEWANNNNVTLFITADHGNSEVMIDKKGGPATKHTDNPVMLVCTDKNVKLSDGKLGNIAPTVLKYMGIEIPKEMTEKPLI
ncbi:2,3-bisphosphoglycerate-independent phosphoglycerate mutase [Mycoplasma zalophidermidis]|uniref:2,3-bisphosphoglycerate-independent phosphoglycerate mutase n=1 Tax=Mycoplasma zalophidermidis TaxID=398174 RepID=A0ABS6DQS6_9MOLU|nr:2,3-bisphosphoglycerate-independent phosphoglycerate mutase [Mycoplasma zalophidermidis]MBU4693357.1 2,3-bisphosphoglycerate-independent phosphoglycerate mutase [Mycoplasma zalophidermidis]MCR8966345.1 2,3-bisphosphoglycerate-independent phosphoglycerate mutase [Mycoplasma zalophidermidis]